MEIDKNSPAYKRAKKQAREIRSFYINLTCYSIIIPILIIINLTFTPDNYWFLFSMIGWGTGLFFHSMSAFNWMPFLGSNWEEKKMKQILEKEEHTKANANKNN